MSVGVNESSLSMPRLLRIPEVTRMLGISVRTLWGLTASHMIPCVRIGRSVRYDLHDLQAWIELQKGDKRGN